ncbi:MAG: hypothetical protein ACOYJB_07380 [Christensenellaceae bacterium]|jgi:Tfp pilus assembly protein PilV
MNEHVKSRGMLLEIIMSVLFFVVVCTIVLQIFAYTKTAGEQSAEKARALNFTQLVAEHFLAGSDYASDSSVVDFAPGVRQIYLDEAMLACEQPAAKYTASIGVDRAAQGVGYMETLDIVIESEGGEVYSLSVDRYLKGGGV